MENIIEFLFSKFSLWLNFVGPLFVNAFLCFFFLVYHSFINNIISFWSSFFLNEYKSKIAYNFFYAIVAPLYTFLFFQTVLNYILVVIIKPGSIEDLKKSVKFKTKLNPYYCYYYLPDLYYILRKGNYNTNIKDKFTYCKYCQEIKPLRTHHCSICGKCNLKMDHHCPWVNNCIGLSNFRYFALFLLYLWFFCIFNTILSVYPFLHLKKFTSNNELSYSSVLCMCGIGISTFFNIWYWLMIINNYTSIEYWSTRLRSKTLLLRSYSLKTIKENLYIVFGTKNIFKILLIPNLKSLNISGLEWSKIVDPSFEIKGIKNNLDLL